MARVARAAALSLGVLSLACGSDGGGGGGTGGAAASSGAGGSGASGGSGGSGAQAGSSGSSGSSGSAGAGGSGATGPGYASNTPNATVTQVAEGLAAGLVITSSQLVDKPSGAEYYQRWTGLLENAGSATVCFPQVDAKFLGAGGAELAAHMSFGTTPPYKGSLTVPISCLAPGEIAGVYSNGFAPTPLDLNAITSVVFTFEAIASDGAVPHPSAPTISGVQLVESFGAGSGYWAAKGSMTATATVYNIGIDVFPVDASGLVPDRVSAYHLDTLFSGSSYAFETNTYESIVAAGTLHTYTDFIEGAGYIAPPAKPDAPASAEQIQAQKHDAQRALRARQIELARRFEARR